MYLKKKDVQDNLDGYECLNGRLIIRKDLNVFKRKNFCEEMNQIPEEYAEVDVVFDIETMAQYLGLSDDVVEAFEMTPIGERVYNASLYDIIRVTRNLCVAQLDERFNIVHELQPEDLII